MTVQQADIYFRVVTGMGLDELAKKILNEHIEEEKAKLIAEEIKSTDDRLSGYLVDKQEMRDKPGLESYAG